MRQYIERISVSNIILSITVCTWYSLLLQSPVPDSCPVVNWGPFHIDLGRELSIMHTTLLVQIPQLKEVHKLVQQLSA